jgi:signal transduction histidine kinase
VDARRFTQVITNLVENAAQALLDEQPNAAEQMEIQINSQVLDHWLKIEVADNGPGMSPQVRDKIFEPLYTTKGFGVGLGLSVVRQIMDLHKGSIEVESELGKGTKVTLYLPLAEDEPSAAKG